MKIKVFKNRYRLPVTRRDIVALAERVAEVEAPGRSGEVSIVFLPDEEMLPLNRHYLNHDYPTDVIAFNLEESPDEALDGEIYIGFEQARRQAKELGIPFKLELRRLVVHGMLHLLGWEDDTPAKKQKMSEREDVFLSTVSN